MWRSVVVIPSYSCWLGGLLFFVASSPRSSTRRMVSLIPSASALPTSARRCRRSSGSRTLMRRLDERWPALALIAKSRDGKSGGFWFTLSVYYNVIQVSDTDAFAVDFDLASMAE